ncbi:MAG: hypothetical protein DBP03_04540 [gamma proteobacterium symbiont of Ctena orbiculata]|nr:MAG: hypothetical protein DBP03_04540 [gamma proteobacterium symbiont of Ctena orbiculata]
MFEPRPPGNGGGRIPDCQIWDRAVREPIQREAYFENRRLVSCGFSRERDAVERLCAVCEDYG